MVTQQLFNYIKQQLEQGISKEQIKNTLLSQGWAEDDIDDGFRKVETGEQAEISKRASLIAGDKNEKNNNSFLNRSNKKEDDRSEDWYVAIMYFSVTVLFAYLLTTLIKIIMFGLLFSIIDTLILKIMVAIIYVLSIWLGAIYSAKHLSKLCIIKNSKNVAKLSTIYLFIFSSGYELYLIYAQMGRKSFEGLAGLGTSTLDTICTIIFIIGIIIFYVVSKKYIKNNNISIIH
ncbi:MAG TPA: hypothetical protein ENL06_00360 [Candidatus Portnoybacteria bacterium]|nr:hypothetical protein [Candidatus Portnoybacteria bacterium]